MKIRNDFGRGRGMDIVHPVTPIAKVSLGNGCNVGWRRVLDYYANVLTDRCYLVTSLSTVGRDWTVIGILIWPNYIATADVATLRSASMYILLYILLFLFLNPIPVFPIIRVS